MASVLMKEEIEKLAIRGQNTIVSITHAPILLALIEIREAIEAQTATIAQNRTDALTVLGSLAEKIGLEIPADLAGNLAPHEPRGGPATNHPRALRE